MSSFESNFKNFLNSYLPIEFIENIMSSLLWQYGNLRVFLEEKYNECYNGNGYFTKLVDNLIEAHETVSGLKKSGEFSGSNAADSAWSLRSAVMTVYRYVNNYLDDKYGTKPYDYAFVRALGEEGASGYRADEYERAMQQGGEYI